MAKFRLLAVGLTILGQAPRFCVCRSLGGSRRPLLIMQVGICTFDVLTGLQAVAGAKVCGYWLNIKVFELAWQSALWLWLSLPVIGGLTIGLAGWFDVRRVIKSPMNIMKL